MKKSDKTVMISMCKRGISLLQKSLYNSLESIPNSYIAKDNYIVKDTSHLNECLKNYLGTKLYGKMYQQVFNLDINVSIKMRYERNI